MPGGSLPGTVVLSDHQARSCRLQLPPSQLNPAESAIRVPLPTHGAHLFVDSLSRLLGMETSAWCRLATCDDRPRYAWAATISVSPAFSADSRVLVISEFAWP